MAEDNFLSTRSGQFRGSRYPGFSSAGAQVDSATGVGLADQSLSAANPAAPAGGGTGSGASSLSRQSFDIPDVKVPTLGDAAAGLGKAAAAGAGQYATTQIGAKAGAALAGGAADSLGDAIGFGAKSLGQDVGNFVGLGGGGVANSMGATAAEVGPSMSAFTSGVDTIGGGAAAGNVAGQAAQQTATSGIDAGVAKLSDGANLGGAAGAGIGRAVVGLATGEKPAAALRAGAGSAGGYYAGTAIGTAIGGPVGGAVGGFIGSTIGSFFCFTAGTPIRMADGRYKAVEALDIDDEVELGGKVVACGKSKADVGDLYAYRGTIVSGGHAVFEDGVWLRVSESERAEKVEGFPAGHITLVYPVCTENMLLVTRSFIAADMTEVEDTWNYTEAERIHQLNLDAVRNGLLRSEERRLALVEC